MAAKTKKSTTSKNSRSKKSTAKTNKGKNTKVNNSSKNKNNNTKAKNTKNNTSKDGFSIELKQEMSILVVFAVCILVVLSSFGLGGKAGEAVSGFMFGMFGYMAYILPFLVFAITVFAISNKGNRHAHIKIGAAIILIILLMAFLGMIINSYNSGMKSMLDYYIMSSERKHAAGLAGGIIMSLLCPLIGVAGTYVVIVISMIICVIFITEKSLLKPLGRESKRAYENAKVKKDNYTKARNRKKEIKQRERSKQLDKKVYGVSFDTTLNDDGSWKKKSPDVKELSDKINDTVTEMPDDAGLNEKVSPMDSLVINRGESVPDYDTEKECTDEDLINDYTVQEDEKNIEEKISISEGPVASGVKELFPEVDDPFAIDVHEGHADRKYEENAYEPAINVEEGTSENEKHVTKRKSQKSAEEVQAETDKVDHMIKESQKKKEVEYKVPPINLLKKGVRAKGDSDAHLRATAAKLEETLQNFGVGVHVTNASCGPSVTRYEIQPDQGVKVSKIVGLADDIKLNLAVTDLRIEAPIPGKAAVGIEVPNEENTAVMLRELLESNEFKNSNSQISFAVGKDIAGKTVVADIAKMPHLLVAGATGSGKSVCINTLIMSILYKSSPEDVKLIMIDPKVVELSVYNGIPHLLIPVVTDPKKAAGALNWAVCEMEKRYKLFAEYNVRDIKGFNKKVKSMKGQENVPEKMPQIVIIVDELADLMMVAPGEVEGAICRLAQLARAAGLHLILATQRPSVNVITGLIKANMPSRIAFSVSSGVDSRTIIDMNGAEKLLGKGDMLFYPTGYPKPVRVQGSFVSDSEVQKVVDYLISSNGEVNYNSEIEDTMNSVSSGTVSIQGNSQDENDAYFAEAAKLIIDKDKASIGMLQRMFKIGFNRAARIMDQLHSAGIVGPEEGTKPRKILMTMEELESYLEENK